MILVIYLLNLNQNVSDLTIYKAISNIVNSWLQLNVIPSKVLKCICGRNSKNKLHINVNVAAILVVMWLQRPQKHRGQYCSQHDCGPQFKSILYKSRITFRFLVLYFHLVYGMHVKC